MPGWLKKIPIRYVAYLVVIVAVVSTALAILLDDRLPVEPKGPPPLPEQPKWKRTSKAVDAANEDFSVEHAAESNRPLAGNSSLVPWTQFNGTLRDNRSTESGLLEAWPEGGPPLLWAAHGLGAGFSSVSVVNGVIYTCGNKADSEALIALDAGTGEKIWSTPFARASHPSVGDGPRSTPTFDEGFVYAMGAGGDLICANAETGEPRWQRNILTDYEAPVITWGMCESVLIDGPKLICTPGGKLATIVALDKTTGKEIWKCLQKDLGASYASPLVANIGGVRQYVQFFNTVVGAVRADDGTFLWQNGNSSSGTNCSSPLVSGDHVFSASNYGVGGALVKLTSVDQLTVAELVYHTPQMKSHHGDMVIVDGLLFGSNDPGILVCLELMTGKVKWQNRSIGKGSVTYADGKIYLRGEESSVALIEATGKSYRELGRFEQPERSDLQAWAHPVVAHGRMFLRDQGLLLCYDVRNSPDGSSTKNSRTEAQ